jgi:threonine-phosphate decarboxylase
MINGHGDEIQTELIANFSSNIWYGANNTALYQHLSALLPSTSRYPEADSHSLKVALAAQNDVEADQIIVCNGSTEAFYLIANAFSGKKSLVVVPTFAEYADACHIHKHTLYQVTRENLKEQIENLKPDLIWICNPNNPDGYCYSTVELNQLLENYPQISFVIDQAYIEFSTLKNNLIPEIQQFKNLIVVQSLTKQYAIPGLRLGYIVSNKLTIDCIEKYKMPWSVNSLAIEAGKYITATTHNDFNIKEWLKESTALQQKINNLYNFEAIVSDTPFFLVNLTFGKASDLKSYLLKQKILVRDATNFIGLEGEYIRICALSTDLNNLLLSHLKIWSRSVIQSLL